jgi:hypothetical protein
MPEEADETEDSPEGDRTVAERAIDYLDEIDDPARSSEIADAIGSTTDYTRSVLNDQHDEGKVDKLQGNRVIGYIIDGDIHVIGSREVALRIISRYGDVSRPEMASKSLDDLRSHIRREIADGIARLDPKVSFRRN